MLLRPLVALIKAPSTIAKKVGQTASPERCQKDPIVHTITISGLKNTRKRENEARKRVEPKPYWTAKIFIELFILSRPNWS